MCDKMHRVMWVCVSCGWVFEPQRRQKTVEHRNFKLILCSRIWNIIIKAKLKSASFQHRNRNRSDEKKTQIERKKKYFFFFTAYRHQKGIFFIPI